MCVLLFFFLNTYFFDFTSSMLCYSMFCTPYVMNCIREESDRKLSDKLHKTSGLFCKTSSYVPQRIVISCKPMSPIDMFGKKSQY